MSEKLDDIEWVQSKIQKPNCLYFSKPAYVEYKPDHLTLWCGFGFVARWMVKHPRIALFLTRYLGRKPNPDRSAR